MIILGGERQVYIDSDDNVYLANEDSVFVPFFNAWIVNDRSLVLRIKRENYSCPPAYVNEWQCARQYSTGFPYEYTSGWVETKPAYWKQYGYIEAKIKIPYEHGFWPAFWTYEDAGATTYEEIDIFEMLPGKQEPYYQAGSSSRVHNYDYMTTNVHTEAPNSIASGMYNTNSVDDYREWHKYGLEWSPSKLIWYVDDQIVRVAPNPGINIPTRIILNLALNPSISPLSRLSFPSEMKIDYVKTYDLRRDCANDLLMCNYNFSNHDNMVKKSITIGDGSCSNSLNTSDNVFLRSSEGVTINGDFTVPLGA